MPSLQLYEQSFGAAQTVTGSAHLLVYGSEHILIDCGMFQGINENMNYRRFTFSPHKISALLITHAHLDHVGRIPLLYKQGFKGTVFAHPATFDIAKTVLMDSAKLQEEEYRTKYKKALRQGKEKYVKKPLYTKKEIKQIFKRMKKIEINYNEKIKISDNFSAVFKDAGHIIGSSFIEISFREFGISKKVIFSGDLGNKNNSLLPPPQKHSCASSVFIESTYGDRKHKNIHESIAEFEKVIINTLKNGGNVLIPSFAIERAQQLLCFLKKMSLEKKLPKNTKIFLDSPMANKVTKIYKKWDSLLSEECRKYKSHPFEFDELKLVKSTEESRKINDIKNGAVIIAGSGMCNGGRILHHIKHRIWNSKNSILFVGYQAKGTLGRKIVNGAKQIKIFHEKIAVKASVYTINGFSAHADQHELIEWLKESKITENIYLIHGEKEKQKVLKKAILKDLNIKPHIVKEREKIYL